jgi:hypothetical protein
MFCRSFRSSPAANILCVSGASGVSDYEIDLKSDKMAHMNIPSAVAIPVNAGGESALPGNSFPRGESNRIKVNQAFEKRPAPNPAISCATLH